MLRSSWRGLDGLPESSAWRVRGARRGTSVVLACSASFRWIRASTRPGAIHYSVATTPDGAVLGWGHAILIHQLPGPGFPTGLMGQINSVITASEHRGHGVGAAVTSSLLRWLTDQGAEVVDLLASGSALGLYRRLGFTEPHSTALRYVP